MRPSVPSFVLRAQESGDRFFLEGLFVSLSPPCDLRCVFCSHSGENVPRDQAEDFPLDEIFESLKCTYPLLARKDFFIGGDEPMHFSGLLKIVAYARQLGFKKIELFTASMRLAERSFLGDLVSAGVNRFNIPFYGPTARVHDAVVRTPGSFRALTKGLGFLSRCKRAGVEIVPHTLLINSNADFFGRTVDRASLYSTSRLVQVWFFEPQSHSRAEYERFVLPPDRLKSCLSSSSHHCRFLGYPFCFIPSWARKIAKPWMKNNLRREVVWVAPEKINLINGLPYHQRCPEKYPACAGCSWRSRCRGVHPAYIDIFGKSCLGFSRQTS